MDLGPHAVFIWASYGIYAAVLGAVIVWLIADGAGLSRRLAELDARGIKRRSAATTGVPPAKDN
jgi:heme exporter protein D